MINVTNNYFADLNTAVDAGLFTRDGKNPKKPELYAAIEAYNNQAESVTVPDLEVAPVDITALEAAGDEETLQAALLVMDEAEDVEIEQKKAQRKAVKDKATKKDPAVKITWATNISNKVAEIVDILPASEAGGFPRTASWFLNCRCPIQTSPSEVLHTMSDLSLLEDH